MARKPPPSGALAVLTGSAACAAALCAMLSQWEGKRNVGYLDVVGIATACYGDTRAVKVGEHYTDAECAARLERQAYAHTADVLACTPGLKGYDNQLVAAASLTYNIGARAYCRSTIARRFNARQWRAACDGFPAWNKAGGKVWRGLVRRRAAERALCLQELPA